MNALAEAAPAPASVAGRIANLFLFFRCHDWTMAVDASPLERIISPDDARLLPVGAVGGTPPPKGCTGILAVGRQSYAAWDLGLMLGVAPLSKAWILVQFPRAGRSVSLALGTGSCLSVESLSGRGSTALPPGITTERGHFLAGTFPASEAHARWKSIHSVGLRVQLLRLWTESELDYSALLLEHSPLTKPGVATIRA